MVRYSVITIQDPCKIWYCRLLVSWFSGSRLLILEEPLPRPLKASGCQSENIGVSGLGGRAEGKPLADPVPPRGKPLQPKLLKLACEGGRPVAHHGCHGHLLGPLQRPPLGHRDAWAPHGTSHLKMGTTLRHPVLHQGLLVYTKGPHPPKIHEVLLALLIYIYLVYLLYLFQITPAQSKFYVCHRIS